MSRDFVNPGLSSSKTWVAVKEIPPVIDTFIKKDYKFNHYKAIAERAKELCEDWIQTNKKNGEGIEASVTCRAKEKTSLRQKLVMRHDEMKKDGGTGYQSTQEILTEIVDLAGVRIILYMPSETQQERVKEMIQDIFDKEVQPKVHSGSQRSRAAGGPRPADQEKQLRSSKSYEPTHLGYTAVHYRVAMMEKHGDRHYDHAEDDRVSQLTYPACRRMCHMGPSTLTASPVLKVEVTSESKFHNPRLSSLTIWQFDIKKCQKFTDINLEFIGTSDCFSFRHEPTSSQALTQSSSNTILVLQYLPSSELC